MPRSTETEPMIAGASLDEARVLFVVIHGRYGAPEAMMDHLVRHLTAPDVTYLLPRAAGNSWYDARGFDPLNDHTRGQLSESLVQIAEDIDAARAAGAPVDRMVIGGFSQGACMSLEAVMSGWLRPQTVCALTGFRIGAIGDDRPGADLTDLPVYLSNGARDPFITLPEFADTLRLLGEAGARVHCDLFPRSAHVMSPVEIATVDGLLRCVARDAPLFEGAGV